MPYAGIPISAQGTAGGVATLNDAAQVIVDQLASNAHVLVRSDGLPAANGQALLDAYAAAKVLTPGGNARSASNRATLFVLPGTYNLPADLTLDVPYVDVIGVGDRGAVRLEGRVAQTADDVTLRHLYIDEYWPDSDLPAARLFDIATGSMRPGITYSGTYVDCRSDTFLSFGGGGVASGTFIRCQGGALAFGGDGTASGTFVDCEGDFAAFGGGDDLTASASGTFLRCRGGISAFGGNEWDQADASGEFTDCIGNFGSFGGSGFGVPSLTGRVYRCRLLDGAFPTPTGGGRILLSVEEADIETERIVNAEAAMTMRGERITNLGTPTTDADAATRQYVDDAVNT